MNNCSEIISSVPGLYRTRAGLTVRIIRKHPRHDDLYISDEWSETNLREYWWGTGVHPHNPENDLVGVVA